MKKILTKLAPVLLFLTLCSTPVFAQSRVGIIDLSKVFDNYWKTKEATAALKTRAGDMDKQNKDLMDKYKSLTEDYQKLLTSANDQAVSAEERGKRKAAADAKQQELKDQEQAIDSFRRSAATTLDEQKRRMRDKILVEIRAAIDAKAKAAGYSIVLDSAAMTPNATPVVLYTNGDNDMTTDILSQLNATAPVGMDLSNSSTNAPAVPADGK